MTPKHKMLHISDNEFAFKVLMMCENQRCIAKVAPSREKFTRILKGQ